MFGARSIGRKRPKDEGEKPFWISFADLMSALMVLFLVVMSVALSSVTKRLTEQESLREQRARDIQLILARFQQAANTFPGIVVDATRQVIDFGEQAQFALSSSTLTGKQQALLRAFVPEILRIANDSLGKRILKRIVVEGYTDKTGSYLSNLNLSLQRSQRVLCAMFARPTTDETALTLAQLEDIRALFLVGVYSFNAAKDTDALSRRVEMRLEFLGIGENRDAATGLTPGNFGQCALGGV
jgi:outer membrane protein OmpA-like peptidoglycan-associated protein